MNEQLRELILNVVESSDSTGCSEDLTVVSSADLEALADYLQEFDKTRAARAARAGTGETIIRNMPVFRIQRYIPPGDR